MGESGEGYHEFELVVGLEIHAQLNTRNKIFSGDATSGSGAPNEQISIVSAAMPGALPYLNYAVIEKAVRMGLALNCTINQLSKFDRKHYFYADLPKGYQITQDAAPICGKGNIKLHLENEQSATIGINRIHLEEDAGKSIHDQDPELSFVDLNRAGVPLIEIVTEPDIRSGEEAAILFSEIRKLVRHLDVGDGNMEAGNLRCDANISVRPSGARAFGTRCEVKNLNSIKNLRRAIEFEFRRQVEVIRSGGTIIQSTLNFDADSGATSPMRSKEEANDYRYFPDPDLPPIVISDDWLSEIRKNMPELPEVITANIMLEACVTEGEAALISEDPEVLAYYNAAKATAGNRRSLINWINGPVRALLTEHNMEINKWLVSPVQISEMQSLVEARKLTQQTVFQRLIPLVRTGVEDVEMLASQNDLLINTGEIDIENVIEQVLLEFSMQVAAYKKGKKGVLGLFVGEVMKKTKGKADPAVINQLILKKLEI